MMDPDPSADPDSGADPQAPLATAESAPAAPPADRRGLRLARRLVRILWGLVWTLVALLILRTWVLAPYRIPTASMEPTLRGDHPEAGIEGDTVLVLKAAYWLADPARFDLVAFLHAPEPGEGEVGIVKRVVGLPGETIEIFDGGLRVDGSVVPLPAALAGIAYRNRGRYGWHPLQLGEDEYFLLGDNSAVSEDSRHWGPLRRERIFGRVIAVLAPRERLDWAR